jgi:predicted transcriptional regulator of viral defense system
MYISKNMQKRRFLEMKYLNFKNSYQNVPVFNISALEGAALNKSSIRDNINKWTRKGYLYRLKNNLYTLNDNDRKTPVSRFFIANYIYTPSYVSLEYAMYHYGMIPETVYEMTSVTASKTAVFKNHFGVFSYSTLKSALFFGVVPQKDENGMNVLVASPEKAFLDFIYLRYCRRSKTEPIEGFIEKNRVQNLKMLDKKVLNGYIAKFPALCAETLRRAFDKGEK